MSDKSMNILRAVVCAFIAICCFGLKALGIASEEALYPYVAGGFCVFLTIAYLKQAFAK